MKKLKKTGLLALAGAALVATAANASAGTVTFNPGDLLMGFVLPGASSGDDYVVDIGQLTNYTNATAPAFTISGLGNTQNDLNTAFGTNWSSSNTSTLWGVAGTTDGSGNTDGVSANTLFVTAVAPSGAGTSIPWTSVSSSNQGATRGKIQNITGEVSPASGSGNPISGVNQIGGANGQTTTSDSTVASLQSLANDTNAWSTANPPTGSSANAGSSDISFGRYSTIQGLTNQVLDLYEMHPVNGETGQLLGSFSLNQSTGAVTYTPVDATAVPEPSTWASLFLAAGGVLMLARRRGTAVQA